MKDTVQEIAQAQIIPSVGLNSAALDNAMIAKLTAEQAQALRDNDQQPTPVIDPATQERYVLIPQDRYDRLRSLLEDEPFTLAEQRRLLQDMGRRAGWDDPEMDGYDHYDELRGSQS